MVCLCLPAPQQLEVDVLGLGLASRIPSGLRGGGDSGVSKDKAEICARGGGGAATWTGETEPGAAVRDVDGDSGTTAPPMPPPPLQSLASRSRSR